MIPVRENSEVVMKFTQIHYITLKHYSIKHYSISWDPIFLSSKYIPKICQDIWYQPWTSFFMMFNPIKTMISSEVAVSSWWNLPRSDPSLVPFHPHPSIRHRSRHCHQSAIAAGAVRTGRTLHSFPINSMVFFHSCPINSMVIFHNLM